MSDKDEMAELESLVETVTQWMCDDTAMQLARGLTGRDDITQGEAYQILNEVCRDANLD